MQPMITRQYLLSLRRRALLIRNWSVKATGPSSNRPEQVALLTTMRWLRLASIMDMSWVAWQLSQLRPIQEVACGVLLHGLVRVLMQPWRGTMTLSAEQYFETRRKEIDAYVQGEHAWFGCTDTTLPNVSAYPNPIPWYMSNDHN